MDTSDTALHGQNTTAVDRLYMAFELGKKRRKLSLGEDRRARCSARCGRCSGSGISKNGAPLLSAPGLRRISGM